MQCNTLSSLSQTKLLSSNSVLIYNIHASTFNNTQKLNSTPKIMMKIIQEIDFWDDRRPRRLVLFRSSPFLEEINFWDEKRPKNTHDYPEDEISFTGIDSSISSSSIKVSPSPSVSSSKRARSITTFDQESTHDDDDGDIQETTHHHKKRKISTTLTLFPTGDDHVEEKDDDWEKRWKAKGKEKITDELELDYNYNPRIFNPAFFEDDQYNKSRALVIYEPRDNKKKEKKKAQPRKCSKKKSAERQKEPSAPLPPLMHQEIKNRGGSDPFFLFQKDLTRSDVGRNLSRLFINQSERLMEALTEEERRIVDNEEYYTGLRVFTMDPHAEDRDYEMELTRWNIGAYMIVLKKEWMKFVGANHLQEGDRVEGWGYRNQLGDFCLALNAIRKVA